ncbi:MAG: class I lanthipeptide [Candidatus Aminicenantes bacterium]|nr:class I lanthipeptide [Candidatus Aminicenantes bacterium]
MKTKQPEKKLKLSKVTIATLNNQQMKGIAGGAQSIGPLGGCNSFITCFSICTSCQDLCDQ